MVNHNLTYSQMEIKNPNLKEKADLVEVECSFCLQLRDYKVLALTLVRRLSREARKYREEDASVSDHEESLGWKQLVKIVFSQGVSNSSCGHQGFQSFILKKVKITHKYLDFISEKIASQLSQRNYQLEVTALQIKNVTRTLEDKTPDMIQEVKGRKGRVSLSKSILHPEEVKKEKVTETSLKTLPLVKEEEEQMPSQNIQPEQMALFPSYPQMPSGSSLPQLQPQPAGYPNLMYYPYGYYYPPH